MIMTHLVDHRGKLLAAGVIVLSSRDVRLLRGSLLVLIPTRSSVVPSGSLTV